MRLILGLLVIAIFGLVVLSGSQAALTNAAEKNSITNESWTPNAGTVTTLENSELEYADYEPEVEVYDSTGTLMTNGSDYRWFKGNGTVKALVGGDLDGETSATISYNYTQTTKEQRRIVGITSQVPRLMGVLVMLVPVLLLFAFIRG
jgi:hypothetical protein